MITAAQFAQNWGTGLQNATQKIQAGVQAVQQSPAAAAVQNQDKMKRNLIASIDNGVWAAGLSGYTLQMWQQDMIKKGVPRIADGVQNALPKVQKFAQQLLPYVQSLQAQVKQMPNNTDADADARMLAWARGMRQFTYNKT